MEYISGFTNVVKALAQLLTNTLEQMLSAFDLLDKDPESILAQAISMESSRETSQS